MAWGFLLVDTFRILGVTDNEVITNACVGRSNYYKMKRGRSINMEAFVRMYRYARRRIREQVSRRLLPNDFEKMWTEQFKIE